MQLPSKGAYYDFRGAHYNQMESDLLSHCNAVRGARGLLIKRGLTRPLMVKRDYLWEVDDNVT